MTDRNDKFERLYSQAIPRETDRYDYNIDPTREQWKAPEKPQAELRKHRRPGDPMMGTAEMEDLAEQIGDPEAGALDKLLAAAGIATMTVQGKQGSGRRPTKAYQPGPKGNREYHPGEVPRRLDPAGFYSEAEYQTQLSLRDKGTPAQWMRDLEKAGTKPVELKAMGYDQLDPKKVYTREEMLDHAAKKRMWLEETRYGEPNLDPTWGMRLRVLSNGKKTKDWEVYNLKTGEGVNEFGDKSYVENSVANMNTVNPLRWGAHTLDESNPTNREVVLGRGKPERLQEIEARLKELEKLQYGYSLKVEPEAKAAYEKRGKEYEALSEEAHNIRTGMYQEGHFPGVPDYQFHLRHGLFNGPDGKQRLVLGEAQATGAQKIRDTGGGRDEVKIADLKKRFEESILARDKAYTDAEARIRELGRQRVGPEGDKTFGAVLANAGSVRPHRIREMAAMMDPGLKERLTATDDAARLLSAELEAAQQLVPTSPLTSDMDITNKAMMRKALIEAARSGVDGVVLEGGPIQNERYGLHQHAGALRYNPDVGSLQYLDHAHASHPNRDILWQTFGAGDLKPEALPGIVGKEMAGKLLRAPKIAMGGGSPYEAHTLHDLGAVEIGGAGMDAYYGDPAKGERGIYGNILGNELNRLSEQYKSEQRLPGISVEQRREIAAQPGARPMETIHGLYGLDSPIEPSTARQDQLLPLHSYPLDEPQRKQILKGMPYFNWLAPGIAGTALASQMITGDQEDKPYWSGGSPTSDVPLGDKGVQRAEGGEIDTADIINQMRAMAPSETMAATPRLPSDRLYDYAINDVPTGTAFKRDPGEIKNISRPEGWDMAGNEGLARGLGQSIRERDLPGAAVDLSGLIVGAAGMGAKRNAKLPAKRTAAAGTAAANQGIAGETVLRPSDGVVIAKDSTARGIHGETFYDATVNGQLVGRLKVHEDNSVGNVFVFPEHQRQGIASALYDYAAKDRGVDRLPQGSYRTPEGLALRQAYDTRNAEEVHKPTIVDLPSRSKPPMKSLEQFVDELNARPSAFGPNFYSRYLEDKHSYVPKSLLEMPAAEKPYQGKREASPEVKALSDPKVINHLDNLLDYGMLKGPEGNQVNPWYWPIWTKLWEDRLGDKGHDLASRWAGYNAATSMATAVPRNQLEAFMLYHHDLNDKPFKSLSNSELTGKPYHNKVKISGEIAEGEGIERKSAPKIRSFWPGLLGAGTEPMYHMTSDGPVVLDGIMGREMSFGMDEAGVPKRWIGPAYAEGTRIVNDRGRQRGAAPMDTQAGIWQQGQTLKHGKPIYGDPFARILDDNVLQIAKQEGVHPEKVLDELIEGRRLPPNFWHEPESFGKARGGAIYDESWPTEVKPEMPDPDGPPISWMSLGAQLEDRRPIRYPLSGQADNPLAHGVDQYYSNLWTTPSDYLRTEHDYHTPEPTMPVSPGMLWGDQDRESANVDDRRYGPKRWLDQARMWLEGDRPADGQVYADGRQGRAEGGVEPDWGSDITTADIIKNIPFEPANSMDVGAWMRDRSMRGEKFSPGLTELMALEPQRDANLPWLAKLLSYIPQPLIDYANFTPLGAGKLPKGLPSGRKPAGAAGSHTGDGAKASGLPERGGLPGGNDGLPPPGGSNDPYTPIPGQPRTVKIPGHGELEARPIPGIELARRDYLERAGLPDLEPASMPKLDEARARRIAQAYEDMQHDPTNPDVRRAYEKMIEETIGQLDALERQGYQFKFNKPGEDPYAASPAIGYVDMLKNGELSVFPTLEGFGSGVKLTPAEVANNPLLTDIGRKWQGAPITANDAFRAVHDAYGHFGPGNPFFRAPGEERAWGHHSLMYTPEARRAMTSETRGQNSWLNFGPHAEKNKTASGADTIYADQKTGILPDWAIEEGVPPIREKASGGSVDTGDFLSYMRANAEPEATVRSDSRVPTYLPEQQPATQEAGPFRKGLNAYAALGNEWLGRMPSTFGNVLTGKNPSDANTEREDALSYGRSADLPGFKASTEMLDNPMSPAIFIGPAGAKKLADAKIRHADDWGGSNRLKAAEQQWQAGDKANLSQAEVWKEHGWTPHDTWGVNPKAPYQGDPATWLSMPGLSVSDRAMQPMVTNGVQRIVGDELLPKAIDGADHLFTADPRLTKVRAKFDIDPNLTRLPDGTAGNEWVFAKGGGRGITPPIGMEPRYIRLYGANVDELNELLPHELGHSAAAGQRLAPLSYNDGYLSPLSKVSNSAAEQILTERVAELRKALDDGGFNFGDAQHQLISSDLAKAVDQLKHAQEHAAYFAKPHEWKVREGVVRHRVLPDTPAAFVPGTVDSYHSAAMPRRLQQDQGVPFKSFDPSLTTAEIARIMREAKEGKADGGEVEGFDKGGDTTPSHEIPSAEPYAQKVWREAGDKKKYGQEPFEGVDKAIEVFKGNTSGYRWFDPVASFSAGIADAIPPIGMALDASSFGAEPGGMRNARGYVAALSPTGYYTGLGLGMIPSAFFGAPGLAWMAYRAGTDPNVQRMARDWYHHGNKPQTELDPSDIEYASPAYPRD